jgi:hypothetical protein
MFFKVGKMNTSSNEEDIVKVELPRILEAIKKYLEPEKRGLRLVFTGVLPLSTPSIHYESAQCKIRINYTRDRPYEDIEMHISYGRQHAPFDKQVIEWNNKRCYCWHSLEGGVILNFLDGLSPSDITNEEFRVPRLSKTFYDANRISNGGPVEFLVRKHAFLWEHYGQRLFNLFDLNYPGLWQDYTRFLQEYYEEKVRQKRSGIPFDPPRHQVC